MKYRQLFFLFFSCALILAQLSCSSSKMVLNDTSPWTSLFNGNDLSDWTVKIHKYGVGENYGGTFRVRDSIIQVRYDQYEGDFDDRFGHLYFNTPYSYYHLSLDYRFVGEIHPGTPFYAVLNSGIMFHSQDPHTMPIDQDWPISVEMQFLAGQKEGVSRPTGNMCSPGTDIVFQGKVDPRHCINSTSETYYGDQWVHAEIIVLGDSLVTHFINGKEVLRYTDPQVGGGVANRYDPKYKVDGTLLSEGYIALQSEGQPIDFKNIKLKNLKGCMDPAARNFRDYYVQDDPASCAY